MYRRPRTPSPFLISNHHHLPESNIPGMLPLSALTCSYSLLTITTDDRILRSLNVCHRRLGRVARQRLRSPSSRLFSVFWILKSVANAPLLFCSSRTHLQELNRGVLSCSNTGPGCLYMLNKVSVIHLAIMLILILHIQFHSFCPPSTPRGADCCVCQL